MSLFLQSLTFGFTVLFLLIGLIGIVIPVLPGLLFMWLTIIFYALLNGFDSIGWGAFTIISFLSIVMGTSDLWLTMLGSKATGASGRSILFGMIGSMIGFVFLNLIGAFIGYMVGTILGEYHKVGDWDKAIRVSMGGLAGMGISTVLQLGAGILVFIIFIWQVLF